MCAHVCMLVCLYAWRWAMWRNESRKFLYTAQALIALDCVFLFVQLQHGFWANVRQIFVSHGIQFGRNVLNLFPFYRTHLNISILVEQQILAESNARVSLSIPHIHQYACVWGETERDKHAPNSNVFWAKFLFVVGPLEARKVNGQRSAWHFVTAVLWPRQESNHAELYRVAYAIWCSMLSWAWQLWSI